MPGVTHDYDPTTRITDLDTLQALYGEPLARSLLKELDALNDHYAAFVRRAPFVAIATSGEQGLDISPRGDGPGFVRIADSRTLLLPDRRGNNRLDTLRNIVRDPRVSLLFLIPGVGETLRVAGRASIVSDRKLCDSFAVQGKSPQTVLVVAVDKVYYQCQKALVRSRLWDPDARVARDELPSVGEMNQEFSNGEIDAASYDAEYPERMKHTLY